MSEQDNGRVQQAAPGSREPSQQAVSAASGFDPSRGDVTIRRPTLEEATMNAVMRATNATFNWRGQEDLTPLMAVNICAGVIAYLRAMPPGYSLEELAIAIEHLKLALGRDSDRNPEGRAVLRRLGAQHESAGPKGIAQPGEPS